MDTDNYRKRVLHKLVKNLELPKLTFQVIRRTIATLAQKKGTVKDVQGLLRHSRTATTTDVYMQEIPASEQATVNSIHRELKARAKAHEGKKSQQPRNAVGKLRLLSTASKVKSGNVTTTSREKGGAKEMSALASQKGFENLLPNATKPRRQTL